MLNRMLSESNPSEGERNGSEHYQQKNNRRYAAAHHFSNSSLPPGPGCGDSYLPGKFGFC